MEFKNKKIGYSMLELVVVMLIIGTLVSIGISKMSGSDIGAIRMSVKSDMRTIIAQINSCYSDKLSYIGCDNFEMQTGSKKEDRKIGSMYMEVSQGNWIRVEKAESRNTFPSIEIMNLELWIDDETKFILDYEDFKMSKFHGRII